MPGAHALLHLFHRRLHAPARDGSAQHGYYPSDGAVCRFIMAIVDAVPDPPPDGTDPVALFVRTLREAPKRICEKHLKT